ncbi:thrombospondin type-1 domain-containing protein 4-like [Amphibalanus amphitrite]|uniref:thrombospondin type-1 domain-containing protein 4-like n=1 Tax=Amphibalanus amphitrite TaxID=1232801 RepID=UPI001C9281C9|nr:thrombospondin type-1 domain-containing protein 4-like [Amphibalanus amphitrite]
MVQERLARRRYGSEVGQWSGWASWSACSRSCGGGVRTQTRLCLEKVAKDNGTDSGDQPPSRAETGRRRLRPIQCVGSDKRFHMCNEEDCPPEAGDFRAEQCASFNEKPYKDRLYRWRPHYSTKRPCSLTCGPENASFYVTLRRRVIDGTRCSPDGGTDRADHVCAAGHCKHIGCDGVVGSPRVRDACGVCGGDNSTCHLVSGIFTEPHLREGYQLVLQIPAGACSIRIEEVVPTRNYLALRAGNKEFIVNGAWNIDNSGQYQGAGATFMYRRQTDTQGETLAATGPITEPVDIFLLYRQMNRGIKYEYVIKRNASLSSVLPRLPNDLQSLPPAPPPALPALPQLPARPSVVPRPTGHRNAVPAPGVARPPHTAPRLPATPAGAGQRRGGVLA